MEAINAYHHTCQPVRVPDLSTCQAENTGDSLFLNFEKS